MESPISIIARLPERNGALSDTGSFPNKAMKVTPAIIASLEPILGRNCKITNFKVILTSEAM